MSFLSFFHRVVAGEDLTLEQAQQSMSAILEGGVPDAVLGGFLVALHTKGETAQELAGFAQAMREKCVAVDAGPDVVDIVGTGGDGAGTFNISTVASIVLAGAGVPVAKHGNRAISGKVGSADVLEALGVRIAMTPEEAARSVREIGLCFLFAPHLHPALKHVQPVRRELKMRTVFNLLGPLANPANAQMQVIGAPSVKSARMMAEALQMLGTRHSFVIHGPHGLDEVSSTGTTQVFEVVGNIMDERTWQPEDFGVASAPTGTLAGGDAADNAQITLDILNGAKGAPRDTVLMNSAAGLIVAGRTSSTKTALVMAAEAIDSGRARDILQKLQKNFPTK